ncbi:50S ribosomal protein L9 [Limnochorda pilosa]|uniref:Large ribosomal subunit protein bL9 n=1 Tax=Limnochorda pilosa TaxID=1555112 RepID=A0A0K2SQZ4_LIMPI|nr:50S ribosomal protein L9 [Limnochorda pilosa]BAS29432.1 50S ribosomal protein L9 [Limnochorda pilosa]
MKVILKETVHGLGEKGDVVDVAPGHARNYLFPRGFAMEATRGNLKQVEHLQKVRAQERAREESQLRELAARIDGIEVSITARAGAGGKLFGSVTAQDLAQAIRDSAGEELDRRKIQLAEPIRTLGRREVVVRLAPGIEASVVVVVTAEGGQPPAEASGEPAAAEAAEPQEPEQEQAPAEA